MANPRQFIGIEVSGEELYLDSDVATTVCLVINELVQNSFKHAFVDATEGRIAINLSRKRDRMYIDVWDNGSGANVATENGGTGLGLRLVEILLEQLKGEFVVKNIYGTQVSLSFPVAQEKGEITSDRNA